MRLFKINEQQIKFLSSVLGEISIKHLHLVKEITNVLENLVEFIEDKNDVEEKPAS